MRRIGTKPAGLAVGAVYAVHVFSHMAEISMVQAAYLIAVKRTSLLMGFLRCFLFREELSRALFGAAACCAGLPDRFVGVECSLVAWGTRITVMAQSPSMTTTELSLSPVRVTHYLSAQSSFFPGHPSMRYGTVFPSLIEVMVS